MIRFLLIGDRHNSEHIPKCRKDDFQSNSLKKDLEIIELAKKHHVDAILHPGDFWTDADHKLKNDFIAKVANLWDNIYDGDRKIPLIGIAGNHDLIGENVASIATTTTGLLDALGIFKLVSNNNPFIIEKDNKKVVITGVNYHKGMDKPEFICDYIVPQHLGDVHIHIVHGMLSYKNLGKIIRHTKIENILETKADITFCGHDHNGFGIVQENGKYFINPGAVVRLSADKKEIARDVGVVLVTIDNCINCEFIKLNSALPSDEVIDRSSIDKELEFSEFTRGLKDKVENMDIGNSIGLDDILGEIYDEKKISDNIKADIKQSIDKNISQKPIPLNLNSDDCSIKKIHLVNFQSHANTLIELDRNFNVIVGESRQGKSSILRAIRWVIENKPSGKSFIKTGAQEASVEITLNNGTIIKRFVNKKENGYKIFFKDGKIEEGNTKMVARVQEVMGYSNLKIDENTSIPLNFLRQGDSWYLIGEKYSSTDRARILGALKNTNAADAAIKEFEKENLQLQTQIRKQEIEVANSEMDVSSLSETVKDKELLLSVLDKYSLTCKIQRHKALINDFEEKSLMVSRIDSAFSENSVRNKILKLNKLLEKLSSIKRFLTLYNDSLIICNKQAKIVSNLPDVDSLNKKIVLLRESLRKIERIANLNSLIVSENKKIAKFDSYVQKLEIKNDILVKKIDSLLTKYISIKNNWISIHKAERTIQAASKFIDNSKVVEDFANKKIYLIDKINSLKKIQILQDRISTSEKELESAKKNFDIADLKMDEALNNKISILSNYKVCPTCYKPINNHELEDIFSKFKED